MRIGGRVGIQGKNELVRCHVDESDGVKETGRYRRGSVGSNGNLKRIVGYLESRLYGEGAGANAGHLGIELIGMEDVGERRVAGRGRCSGRMRKEWQLAEHLRHEMARGNGGVRASSD